MKADALLAVVGWLKSDPEMQFDLLACVCGTDDTKNLWTVYHLYSIPRNQKAVLKVQLDRENPTVPSLVPVWNCLLYTSDAADD